MSKKALSPELQDQLDGLAVLPNGQIDTTDIPEVSAEAWQHARRPGLYADLNRRAQMVHHRARLTDDRSDRGRAALTAYAEFIK